MTTFRNAGGRGPGRVSGGWLRVAAVLGMLAVPLAAAGVTAVPAAAATTYTVTATIPVGSEPIGVGWTRPPAPPTWPTLATAPCR